MIKCAVLGSPISHSLSPRLHRAAYTFLGVKGTYEAIELNESEFPLFFHQARNDGWSGFSLTMPLKERVNTAGIEIDPLARKINSVNTLYWRENGWMGSSTDYSAFRRIFSTISYSSVCVIGGGATARAALAALDGTVASVSVALRDAKKIEGLQTTVGETLLKSEPFDLKFDSFDLVISTVPAGATDGLAHRLTRVQGTLFDVLYNPWPTRLAANWHQLGGRVINGLDLLVEQAIDQISLMTGREFSLEQMRNCLNQALLVERASAGF